MHEVKLAGKVLSQLNSDRLKAAFVEIGKMLIAAGAISTSDLSNLFEGVADNFEGESTLEAGAGISLRERYKTQVVWSNFRQLLSNLETMCTGILGNPRDSADRVNDIASEFKGIFNEILLEASTIDPMSGDSEMPYRNGLYCAKAEDSSEDTTKDTTELSASQLVDVDILFDLEEPLVLEASIEVDAKSLDTLEASSNPNTTPLKGVLFRIDEASESAPSKGSTYPLYIPKDVAEKAMEFVNAAKGLPLDADDSLSKHANEDIIGIMTSAEIDNSDFVVKGHLFPWSQKDKVGAIALNQNDLGMSLNGRASGNIVEMDGTKVFHLSSLEILGANILLKKRATYQKTRLYPMGEIAASAPENQSTEEENMELERAIGELQKTLAEISAASAKESELSSARIQQLTEAFNSQQQLLQTIQAEREQSISAAQSQSFAAQKAEEQQELLAAIGAVVQAQVAAQKEEIINSINPRRSPQRITQSLVGIAAAGQEGQQSNAVRDELLVASGELKVLEDNQIIGPQRNALVDRIHNLRQRMSAT